MKYRKLGKNGPIVSAIGFGCMGLSGYYGSVDEKASKQVIQDAYENGVTFFDTADMYGDGQNEKTLGEAIKGFKKPVVIATKCGIEFNDATAPAKNSQKSPGATALESKAKESSGEPEKKSDKPAMTINSSAEYIKKACDASLKRLGIETIDVYYLHRRNIETSIEESMTAMKDLIKAGKIRYVGLSEVDAKTIEAAHKVLGDKLVAVQTEYSLVNRAAAEAVLPTCRKLGVAFVPYSPIDRGFLSGTITDRGHFGKHAGDFRGILPQFQADTFTANYLLVSAVQDIAKKKACSPAQLSLAWLMAQGDDIVPIPGTRHTTHLKENAAAADIVLTQEELATIGNACKENPVKGARYPEPLLKVFNLTM